MKNTISISTMKFKPKGNGASGESIDKYKVLRIGDIAYEGHKNKSFSFGRFVLNDVGDGIMSPRFTTLRPITPMYLQFWKHYIIYEPIMKHILVKSTKLGTMMNELVPDDFFKLKVTIPSSKEQIVIGKFLKLVDDCIALQQEQLQLYKKLRQGFLQKVFPYNGEKVPRLRFNDFSDEWKLRKLGQLGDIQSGVGFPEKEQGGNKGIPFYKVSDMNNIGNESEMKSANNYVNDDQVKKRKWKPIKSIPAIIFAKIGAAIELNRKRVVKHPFLIDNNTMAFTFDNNWDINFGKNLFETINLPKYAQVGALPSYNNKDIENIIVSITSIDEQRIDGKFLNILDLLIDNQIKIINKHKLLKKYCLQKLFI